MSCFKKPRISLWNREDISYCNCGEFKTTHAHCPCDVCCGKAVARSTEYHHWIATRDFIEDQKSREHVEEMVQESDFDGEDSSTHMHDAHAQCTSNSDTLTLAEEGSASIVNEADSTLEESMSEAVSVQASVPDQEQEEILTSEEIDLCTPAGTQLYMHL